jgi:hypothetical protein
MGVTIAGLLALVLAIVAASALGSPDRVSSAEYMAHHDQAELLNGQLRAEPKAVEADASNCVINKSNGEQERMLFQEEVSEQNASFSSVVRVYVDPLRTFADKLKEQGDAYTGEARSDVGTAEIDLSLGASESRETFLHLKLQNTALIGFNCYANTELKQAKVDAEDATKHIDEGFSKLDRAVSAQG